jgi:2-polyprenyl-3-methyl-5-hydroxy-6-metoxy-1,4-benzoquinol methylase
MDLKEEDILGNSVSEHWYYRSKLAALLRYTRHLDIRSILDVGAGSGFFSKGLLRETNALQAICVDISYSTERKESLNGKPVEYRKSCGEADVDLVLMMDVLEHVDDDVALLRDYAEKVPVGTYFIITVPAFSFLWSAHDVYLGHKRRYTLSEVKQTMARAEFTIENASYYFGLVFPLAVATRLIGHLVRTSESEPRSQLKKHSPFVNEFLARICALDLLLLNANRLAGLTVFCLARKR